MATNVIGGRLKAAGAVLWRPGPSGREGTDEVEVALVHRPRYDDWSFPKGKSEPGEHMVLTALREVAEETGYRCVLGRRLPNTEYEVDGRPKRVRYWAGRVVPGGDFVPNDEVDRLEWMPGAEARERLTNSLDVRVLDAFRTAPVRTYPIVLQRHGKAQRRGEDYPDDLARPLAATGIAQASALADLLAAYGAADVVSSPAVRCVATVRPYAEQAGLTLGTDPALTEIAYVHAPRAVVAWLRELIARRRGTVVCTHGPLLDELISAVLYNPGLGGSAGPDDGPTIGGHPWSAEAADRWANTSLPTGCAWVLHFDAASAAGGAEPPALVAIDRLKP